MADNATPTGGAAPAAPVQIPITPLPNVADRLTVPASALGLDTDLPPIVTTTVDKTPKDTPPAPSAPAVPAAPAPAPTGPSGPAAPAAAPAPGATGPSGPAATGPAAEPEKKFKFNGKEYTEAELNQILADRNKPTAPAAPAAPAQPAQPPKQLTPEEVQAAEDTWRQNFATEHKVNFALTEPELETILGGGKEAVEALQRKLQDVATRSILLARKSIYADLNPQMEKFRQQVEPLFANHAQVERVATEQAFLASYPEYQGQHVETARQVAEALVARYPEQVSKMSQQDFLAHVNTHTDAILQAEYKRWNPAATDTWREAAKRGAAAPAPTAQPAATAQPAQPAAPAPAAPAAPDPWKIPPAVNAPAATPAAAPGDWNKGVARSLQD